jgi:hypothetical protein
MSIAIQLSDFAPSSWHSIDHPVSNVFDNIYVHVNSFVEKFAGLGSALFTKADSITETSHRVDFEDFAALLVDPRFLARMTGNLVTVNAVPTDFSTAPSKTTRPEQISFEGAIVSPETLEFCAANKILNDFVVGIKLARKHFSLNATIRAYLDNDPEDLDEYVVLELIAAIEPAPYLESYFNYTEEWSKSVTWPASRMILLDLNILE